MQRSLNCNQAPSLLEQRDVLLVYLLQGWTLQYMYYLACDQEIKPKKFAILNHVVFPTNAIPSCVIALIVIVVIMLFVFIERNFEVLVGCRNPCIILIYSPAIASIKISSFQDSISSSIV